jgi:hypothetical protein
MYFLSLFFFNPKIITKHNLKVAKKKKEKKREEWSYGWKPKQRARLLTLKLPISSLKHSTVLELKVPLINILILLSVPSLQFLFLIFFLVFLSFYFLVGER